MHMIQYANGLLVENGNVGNRLTKPLPSYNPTADQLPANPFAKSEKVEPVAVETPAATQGATAPATDDSTAKVSPTESSEIVAAEAALKAAEAALAEAQGKTE